MSDGVYKMEPNIGSEETVGEHTGDKQDFSESECTLTTWASKAIALGEQCKQLHIW